MPAGLYYDRDKTVPASRPFGAPDKFAPDTFAPDKFAPDKFAPDDLYEHLLKIREEGAQVLQAPAQVLQAPLASAKKTGRKTRRAAARPIMDKKTELVHKRPKKGTKRLQKRHTGYET